MHIDEAEQRALARVAEQAYKISDNITSPEIQKLTYELVHDAICLGIRMMQEELMNITETNSPNQ